MSMAESTNIIRDGCQVVGRLNVSYDLLFTQRSIVQPKAELNFCSKDDAARYVGSGLSDLDAGVRIRYEVNRKVAHYTSSAYERKCGKTADCARRAGEEAGNLRFIFGRRLWR